MDDNLFFIREAQPVFADKGHSKGLTVHGFFTTWPVHKLIFCLWNQEKKLFLDTYIKVCNQTLVFQFSYKLTPDVSSLKTLRLPFRLIYRLPNSPSSYLQCHYSLL